MREVIREIITSFHQEALPSAMPRELAYPVLPASIRKAVVFTGMRRVGKTYLMYRHMQQQLEHGLDKTKLLYINFEDDRLSAFTVDDFQTVLDVYVELYPQHINASDVAFYLDEIQTIDSWELFIRRLLDKEKMAITISGSSSKLLSKEIATSLRGRCVTQEVTPLSLREYLAYRKVDIKKSVTKKHLATMLHHANDYLNRGGFPETLDLDSGLHRNIVQSYVNATVFRDVIQRYAIKNSGVVKLFLLYCLQSISSLLSVTKVYKDLKSRGASVGRDSLYRYLEYFEDAFLLFRVPIYLLSARNRQLHPMKIYCVDPGIITAYSMKKDREAGVQLENAVYVQLRRLGCEDIFYYKTQSGKEVDFIAQQSNGEKRLYQVCLDMRDEKTRHREISALEEAARELDMQEGTIITRDYREDIKLDGLTIQAISYAEWAL